MKRKTRLPITSYFTKRTNHAASHESETSNSTSTTGIASTRTVLNPTAISTSGPANDDAPTSLERIGQPENEIVTESDLGTLADGPSQPKLTSYPRGGKKNRSFQATWYSSFPWLEYSVAKDKAFCFACKNFSTATSKSDPAFAKIGFSSWVKAMENNRGFKAHDTSCDHLMSMTRWEYYKNQKANPDVGVGNMLDPDRASLVQNNRDYMKTLLQYHRYFCVEEMAYRGHDETDESLNAGKWKEFIKAMLSTNPTFKKLHDTMKKQYKSYDYTSKRSSIELVEAMATEVRHQIKDQIERAGMYSILIDECKDNAGHEELSTCFRFVNDEGEVQERFYELTRLKETDANTIVKEGVLPTSEQFASLSTLLALGADGASVMSGCYEGVAAKLKRSYPWLLYVHCAAHRLNLIVVEYFRTVKSASNVIKIYKSLHTIFNVASHREIFEAMQRDIHPKEHIMAASSLTEVRWACKFEGVNTIVRRFQAILMSLQKISSTNSSQADSAAGLYHRILLGKFVVCLCFVHKVLSILNGLSKFMQEISINWITVGSEMVAVRKLLVEIKIDIIETATNLCSTVGITPDYEDPLSNTRNDTTTPRELCESLKTTSIPLLLQELERRFSGDNIKVLKAIEALDASKSNYLDYASLTSLTEMYENCLRIDSGLLKTECQRAKILINAGKNVDPLYILIYLN